MEVTVATRVFGFSGLSLADPDERLSIEEVRSFYAAQYPELTTATITGPEMVGNQLRYRFERAIGSKG